MARLKEYSNITPSDKLNILNQSINFSDDDGETATELIKNEANGIADLVNILKPEALENKAAVEEIAEATDTDVKLVEDMANTKSEVNEKGDEAGLTKEEKEEYFSEIMKELLPSFVQNSYNRHGLEAFFSNKLLYENFADTAEDTVEGIKLIKYVDEDAIESKSADEIADIISEATDADKEAVKDVVEVVQENVNFANTKSARLFSDTINELAKDSAIAGNQQVQAVMAVLNQAADQEQQRLAAGENVSKRVVQEQSGQETTNTETDPLKVGELPNNIGELIVNQVHQNFNPGNVSAPAPEVPAHSPFVAFSNNVSPKGNPPSALNYLNAGNDGANPNFYQGMQNFSNAGYAPNGTIAQMQEFAAMLQDE